MKILHTADWHLGANLGSEKRYREFEQTLDFLLDVIRKKAVDCVVIAGDIFDVPQPPNRAVELYYKFLTDCAGTGVKDIIVIAGNHDSAAFLEAPALLLRRLRVHVFGLLRFTELEKHLVVLPDAVIAAIPFLHERDIRAGGRTYLEHKKALRDGTVSLFREIAKTAKEKYPGLPLLTTAHFWAAAEKEVSAQEEIGNLDPVPIEDLPDSVDCFLLGHIHSSYTVDSARKIRYAGSLLPMKFGECARELTILDTANLYHPEIIKIPVFCSLREIQGEMPEITAQIESLEPEIPVLLKVVNTGTFRTTLRTDILELLKEKPSVKLVFCQNTEQNPAAIRRGAGTEKLSELTPETVFLRLLQDREIPEKEALLDLFRQAAADVAEEAEDV